MGGTEEERKKRGKRKKNLTLKYIDPIIKTIVFYLYFLYLKMGKYI